MCLKPIDAAQFDRILIGKNDSGLTTNIAFGFASEKGAMNDEYQELK